MKSIQKLVLRTFLRPFLITFPVLLFIFLTHHMLKYSDYLTGRGIGMDVILELMYYFAYGITPRVLPLAILLSSLIAFGNLGQHNELTAIKSAGISLVKLILPVFVFIVFLSAVLVPYNDRVIPWANIKAWSLLWDVHKKKFFDLKENTFYTDIDKFRIRVTEKDKESDLVKGVMIYDHLTDQGRNNHVIVADSGKIYMANNEKNLVLELYEGAEYRQNINNGNKKNQGKNNQANTFVESRFKKTVMYVDLKKFGFERTDEDKFKHNRQMLNFTQLLARVDTLNQEYIERRKKSTKKFNPYLRYHTIEYDTVKSKNEKITEEQKKSYNQLITFTDKHDRNLVSKVGNIHAALEGHYKNGIKRKKGERNTFMVELWNRINSSVACVLLFLIGAPIGSIIKKGGLGLPGLITVSFFILYYVLSMQGEKNVRAGGLDPFIGMMYTNIIFLGIGAFFLRMAHTDISFADTKLYQWYQKVFSQQRYFKPKTYSDDEIELVSVDEMMKRIELVNLQLTAIGSEGMGRARKSSQRFVDEVEMIEQQLKKSFKDEPELMVLVDRIPKVPDPYKISKVAIFDAIIVFLISTILTSGLFLVKIIIEEKFMSRRRFVEGAKGVVTKLQTIGGILKNI